MQIVIEWMFIRGVNFICKCFSDIGKLIIEHARSFFFGNDCLVVQFYLFWSHVCLGLLSRHLVVSQVFLISFL